MASERRKESAPKLRVDISPPARSFVLPEFSAGGIVVRHTPLTGTEEMAYEWLGSAHYLALHDMQLRGAETHTDDSPVVRKVDLRGTLTYIPAGCRAWGWGRPTTARQSFTALYLDPNAVHEHLADGLTGLPGNSQIYFSNQALRATLEKLAASLNGTVRFEPIYIETLCTVAILELCLIQRDNLRAVAGPAGRLSRLTEDAIREFIESNMHLDIGLGEIAGIANLSRFHFLRVFQNTFNDTPYRYLVKRRMERAQELLANTQMSIGEIALTVGYKDASRFSRAFSNVLGVSPAKLRRQ
jgi:AraC family transcriptional regulator